MIVIPVTYSPQIDRAGVMMAVPVVLLAFLAAVTTSSPTQTMVRKRATRNSA
jgi:hypothetical protein